VKSPHLVGNGFGYFWFEVQKKLPKDSLLTFSFVVRGTDPVSGPMRMSQFPARARQEEQNAGERVS
jgi:hypothetical protein